MDASMLKMREQLEKLRKNPIVLFTVVPLVVLYLTSIFISSSTGYFALITANTLITNTYVWNIITSCFYETNILKLLSDIISVCLIADFIDIDNMEQWAFFFGASVLACTVGTSIYCFVSLLTTGKEDLLITPIYGFNGMLMVLLMMARQQQRSRVLYTAFPWVNFHTSPIFLILGQLFGWCLGLKDVTKDFSFSIIALFFSWSYLRFFYKYKDLEYGDKSDEFTFVGMFPESLHIVLIPFTTAFYNIVALLGVFPVLEQLPDKKIPHHLYDDANYAAAGPGAKVDVLAERRRAKAMKLLDAKLAEISQESDVGWDVDLDTDSPRTSKGDLSKLKV